MFAYETMLDRRILQEAESLAAIGHDVEIVTPGGRVRVVAGAGTASAPAGYVLPGNILSGSAQTEGAAPDDDTPPPGSAAHRVMHAAARMAGRLGFDLTAVKAVARRIAGPVQYYYLPMFKDAIREVQADIYVGHDLPMLPVALAAAARHGGRAVYDSHELWPEQEMPEADRTYWSRVERAAIGRAAAVFTVNLSIAEEMAKRYGVVQPHVLRNCDFHRPPATRGGLQARLGLAANARVAMFQGRLEPASNLHIVIEAWRHLSDLPLHLVLVGNGSLSGDLRALAAKAGLSERVHFHPHVARAELPDLTSGAAMGLIPYRPTCLNTYYCTPNKLFEYLASEVPVVATDLPELRRLIVGSDVGAVGDTATPEGLADLVRGFHTRLSADPALPARVASVAAALDWHNEARDFVSAMDRLARETAG